MVGLNEVDRVGFKSRFWDLQKSGRIKRWRVPDTFGGAVELAKEPVKQAVGHGKKVGNNGKPVPLSFEVTTVLSLSARLMKARKKVVSTKRELDVPCAAAEFAKRKHHVTLEKV